MTGRRWLFMLVLVLTLLVLALPLAAQDGFVEPQVGERADSPEYALHGPYAVGYMPFSDGAEERPMEGGIWYPALNPDGAEERISYDSGVGDLVPPLASFPGRAILNAAPDTASGPYPLVVSSHGHITSIYALAYLHEHLASQGFVVMAMTHTGNSIRDVLLVTSEEQDMELARAAVDHLVLRPMDISRTLDYAEVLAESELAGIIDMDSVAVIGYSYGGATALVAGGVRYDFRDLPSICASETWMSIIPSLTCNVYGDDLSAVESRLLDLAGMSAADDEMFPSLADPRIDAVVALAPGGGTVLTSEGSITGPTLPALMLRAGIDTTAVTAYNVDRIWQFTNAYPRALVNLEYASHCVGLWFPPGVCDDPIWDKDRAADLIDHFTTAFLLDVLKGDEAAHAALAPEAVAFPGITYEAEGF